MTRRRWRQASIEGSQSRHPGGQVYIGIGLTPFQHPQLQLTALIILAVPQELAHGVVPCGQSLNEDMVVVLVVDLVTKQGFWNMLNLQITRIRFTWLGTQHARC